MASNEAYESERKRQIAEVEKAQDFQQMETSAAAVGLSELSHYFRETVQSDAQGDLKDRYKGVLHDKDFVLTRTDDRIIQDFLDQLDLVHFYDFFNRPPPGSLRGGSHDRFGKMTLVEARDSVLNEMIFRGRLLRSKGRGDKNERELQTVSTLVRYSEGESSFREKRTLKSRFLGGGR